MKFWQKRSGRTGAAARKTADTLLNYNLVRVGVLVTLAAAIITSWNGLIFVAGWQGLEGDGRIVTPLMIDAPLVTLTVVRNILIARGHGSKAVLWLTFVLTAYSSFANFAHSVEVNGLDNLGDVVGAATNALAPWLILAMSEVLALIMAKPKLSEAQIEKARKKRLAAQKKAAKKPGDAVALAEPSGVDQ